MRLGLVKETIKSYIVKYTCASMADSYGTMLSEQHEANEWVKNKIEELHITQAEIDQVLFVICTELKENGGACIYDANVLNIGI